MLPETIQFKHQVFCIDCHPTLPIVASSLISGHVHIDNYSSSTSTRLKAHKSAARSISFTTDGEYLVSGSSDKSLAVISTDSTKVVFRIKNAHKDSINALKILNENFMASGDDAGSVKLWDIRLKKQVAEWKEHSDFISDFDFVEDNRSLLTTSGDGCLSVYDVRKHKSALAVSENQDDELLSVKACKGNSKVVVGSSSGILSIFTWGQWLDSTDRFPGHPASVDSLCKIDDNTLITGSSDGIIREISILPNKFTRALGEHGENFPIECVKITHDEEFVASCSHDSTVRFWSLAEKAGKQQEDVEDAHGEEEIGEVQEEDSDKEVEDDKVKRKKKKRKLKLSVNGKDALNTFFNEID